MQWENLRADEFEAAVHDCQRTCILPIGVLEYHGNHLPLGTDMFIAHRMACDVASVEPAIVYPVVHFSCNFEAKAYPGCIAINNNLLFSLFENVCDEISRNGCHKIILISGHGGNKWFLPQFIMSMVDKAKDWVPFYFDARGLDPDAVGGYMDKELFKKTFSSGDYGHACEWETSEMLHIQPQLVDMEKARHVNEPPQDRLEHLPNTYAPMDWFARQPGLTRGTPGHSTAEKGKIFWDSQVKTLASMVQAVKQDTTAQQLNVEFNRRIYRR